MNCFLILTMTLLATTTATTSLQYPHRTVVESVPPFSQPVSDNGIWTLITMAFIVWIPTLGNVPSSSTSPAMGTRPSCHPAPCIILSSKPPPWPPPSQWTPPWIKPCDGMVVNQIATSLNRWCCPVMTWHGAPHHQSSPFRVCLHHPYLQGY